MSYSKRGKNASSLLNIHQEFIKSKEGLASAQEPFIFSKDNYRDQSGKSLIPKSSNRRSRSKISKMKIEEDTKKDVKQQQVEEVKSNIRPEDIQLSFMRYTQKIEQKRDQQQRRQTSTDRNKIIIQRQQKIKRNISRPMLNKKGFDLIKNEDLQKEVAQHFIQYGWGYLNFKQTSQLNIRFKQYFYLITLIIRKVFLKINQINHTYWKKGGGYQVWKQKYRTKLVHFKYWMNPFQVSAFIKFIKLVYQFTNDIITMEQVTVLYNIMKNKVVDPFMSNSLIKKIKQEKLKKEFGYVSPGILPCSFQFVEKEATELFLASKEQIQVEQVLSKRYPSTDWQKTLITFVLKRDMKSGFNKISRISKEFGTKHDKFPQLKMKEEDFDLKIDQIKEVKMRAALVQAHLVKNPSHSFVSETVNLINKYCQIDIDP